MVAIPAGTFKMGSPANALSRDADEGPQHDVTLSAFWMGEKEVTFVEWDRFFKNLDIPAGKNIDGVSRPTPQYIDLTWGMGRDDQQPTNSMSQQAAMMYCKWLYDQTGVFFRLPTEAEWEYACTAGSTAEPFEKDAATLAAFGFFKDNSGGTFHKTKQLKPNAWGLYDMLGNLSEWTLDPYVEDVYVQHTSSVKDPLAKPTRRYPRVAKGGSYLDEASALRCANRIPSEAKWNQRDPQIPKSKWWLTDGMFMGLRIVRPLQQPNKEAIESFYATYLDH